MSGGLYGFTAGRLHERRARRSLATELRTTPDATRRSRADAPKTCPTGYAPRLLFDSETGTPATQVRRPAPRWPRGYDATATGAATRVSGKDSWYADDPDPAPRRPRLRSMLRDRRSALPAGQPTLPVVPALAAASSYEPAADATTTVARWRSTTPATPAGPVDAASLPWVNGPTRRCTPARQPERRSQGVRRRQLRLGRQPARPVVVRRQDRQAAVHDAHGDVVVSYSAGGSTTSRSTPATAAATPPPSRPRPTPTPSRPRPPG